MLFKANKKRTLVEKDKNSGKDASSHSKDNSDDFKQFQLKGPELEDRHKTKLFNELVGYTLDS